MSFRNALKQHSRTLSFSDVRNFELGSHQCLRFQENLLPLQCYCCRLRELVRYGFGESSRGLAFITIYLNINQRDALNFIMSLFHASTCFEHHVLIVRRSKLYYTASGIITPIGMMIPDPVLSQNVHGTATYRCDHTRGCIVQFCPPDNEHLCSKHVEA